MAMTLPFNGQDPIFYCAPSEKALTRLLNILSQDEFGQETLQLGQIVDACYQRLCEIESMKQSAAGRSPVWLV